MDINRANPNIGFEKKRKRQQSESGCVYYVLGFGTEKTKVQDKKMNILASRGRERRLKGEWGILQRPGDEPGLKEANMGGGVVAY